MCRDGIIEDVIKKCGVVTLDCVLVSYFDVVCTLAKRLLV